MTSSPLCLIKNPYSPYRHIEVYPQQSSRLGSLDLVRSFQPRQGWKSTIRELSTALLRGSDGAPRRVYGDAASREAHSCVRLLCSHLMFVCFFNTSFGGRPGEQAIRKNCKSHQAHARFALISVCLWLYADTEGPWCVWQRRRQGLFFVQTWFTVSQAAATHLLHPRVRPLLLLSAANESGLWGCEMKGLSFLSSWENLCVCVCWRFNRWSQCTETVLCLQEQRESW